MKMTRTEKIREIGKIRAYVERAETEVNKIAVSPRAAHKYPFDLVGLATLSKVFALSRACLKLLRSGLSDEAFGLSRSIVECATNLRYLTAEPALQDKRTWDFVKYALADKRSGHTTLSNNSLARRRSVKYGNMRNSKGLFRTLSRPDAIGRVCRASFGMS